MEYKNNQQLGGISQTSPRLAPHHVRSKLSREIALILGGENTSTHTTTIEFAESSTLLEVTTPRRIQNSYSCKRPTRGNFIPASHFAPLMSKSA